MWNNDALSASFALTSSIGSTATFRGRARVHSIVVGINLQTQKLIQGVRQLVFWNTNCLSTKNFEGTINVRRIWWYPSRSLFTFLNLIFPIYPSYIEPDIQPELETLLRTYCNILSVRKYVRTQDMKGPRRASESTSY